MQTTFPNFGTQLFLRIARGLVALQELEQRGESESLAADAIRDALDEPLAAVGVAERTRARWLSDDLYSVGEPAREPLGMNPQAQAQLAAMYEAREVGDWDRALSLLRRWKNYLPLDLLSYMRGSLWLVAGVPEAANAFFAHAKGIDPSTGAYHVMHLHTLDSVDPPAALVESSRLLADPTTHEPTVVALAAYVLINATSRRPVYEGHDAIRSLIAVLEQNLVRIQGEPGDSPQRASLYMNIALLGTCHQYLGEDDISVRYYSRALALSPDEPELLVARGMILYGKTDTAVKDFERAVSLNCRVVWPYLFLAHHYLSSRRFDACRTTCEAALRLATAADMRAVASVLEEFRAVALAELEFPPRYVREAFETALHLDPENENARRNYDTFETRLATSQLSGWGQRTAEQVRGQALAKEQARGTPKVRWSPSGLMARELIPA